MNIFYVVLVQPMINLLVLVYSLLPGHDFGVTVILVTIFIRLIIWPLQSQTLRSQKELQKIQPEIKKIQDKFKNDPTKMNEKMMELYKEKEVNPFSSCLPSLLQIPIMIALFYALINFQKPEYLSMISQGQGLAADLYAWVSNLGFVKSALAEPFSTSFLGIIDLAKPSIFLAVFAGLIQFVQTKMMMPKDQTQAGMNFMLYMFPALTIIIGIRFPAALPLYWIVTTALAILQQYLIMRSDIEKLEE